MQSALFSGDTAAEKTEKEVGLVIIQASEFYRRSLLMETCLLAKKKSLHVDLTREAVR